MIIRKHFQAACLTAAAITAIGLLSTGAADADTFIPQPNTVVTQKLPDGTVITVSLTNQSVDINPSMGDTPVHRNTWVSANAVMHATNGKILNGWIWPGYIVGCQVDINAVSDATTGSGTQTTATGAMSATSGSTATLSLGPGQEQNFNILDIEGADPFGADHNFPSNSYRNTNDVGVSWKDTTIALTGCAGYAQARAFVKIRAQTDTAVGQIVAWGPPFSLG
ncbi:MspA family porin [Nocardia alni]|uniref:MspA family porin n=1 Tax=Nocardia alni TaxID=2815723 RepID=UPI001C218984|nr:MspA family porin [Nocardia alni]